MPVNLGRKILLAVSKDLLVPTFYLGKYFSNFSVVLPLSRLIFYQNRSALMNSMLINIAVT